MAAITQIAVPFAGGRIRRQIQITANRKNAMVEILSILSFEIDENSL
jgi:hypothetical protein